ncbi:MAG: Hsp20/alpha crystallin family protein [Leptospiraceae bacterium]|nr:Hsp20/alpha crystallin family protein [Leptospiraceae bacterium]
MARILQTKYQITNSLPVNEEEQPMGAIVKHNIPGLVNSFFEDWADQRPRKQEDKHFPSLQLEKNDQEYRLLMPLPGASKDGLKVKVEDGYLKIAGAYGSFTKEGFELVHRDFRRHERFERWLNIDDSKFAIDAIKAELAHGMLEVTLPLRAEEQRKQIEIKVN